MDDSICKSDTDNQYLSPPREYRHVLASSEEER